MHYSKTMPSKKHNVVTERFIEQFHNWYGKENISNGGIYCFWKQLSLIVFVLSMNKSAENKHQIRLKYWFSEDSGNSKKKSFRVFVEFISYSVFLYFAQIKMFLFEVIFLLFGKYQWVISETIWIHHQTSRKQLAKI